MARDWTGKWVRQGTQGSGRSQPGASGRGITGLAGNSVNRSMATVFEASRLPLPPNAATATKSASEQPSSMSELWPLVLAHLSTELPEQQVNTWLRPLQAVQEEG